MLPKEPVKEARVQSGGVAFVDGDVWGAEHVDELADEVEDFGLRFCGDEARALWAKQLWCMCISMCRWLTPLCIHLQEECRCEGGKYEVG